MASKMIYGIWESTYPPYHRLQSRSIESGVVKEVHLHISPEALAAANMVLASPLRMHEVKGEGTYHEISVDQYEFLKKMMEEKYASIR